MTVWLSIVPVGRKKKASEPQQRMKNTMDQLVAATIITTIVLHPAVTRFRAEILEPQLRIPHLLLRMILLRLHLTYLPQK